VFVEAPVVLVEALVDALELFDRKLAEIHQRRQNVGGGNSLWHSVTLPQCGAVLQPYGVSRRWLVVKRRSARQGAQDRATLLAHIHANIGAMEPVPRKVVYRLYPSRSQEMALLDMLALHQRLYNAALEQRIAAWRLQRKSLSAYDQMRDLTDLRADDDHYAGLNAQSAQVTLNRLHLAFAAFYRRCKKGETPGFPRFRSFERFSGWGYKTHGDGFRFAPGERNRHGRLRLSGIGTIPVRGRARTPGEVKTCDIQHKAGRWYASLTLACESQRKGGTGAIGLDWGVETFATLAHENGTFSSIQNPRFFARMKVALESAQQNLARKAKRSKNRAKARKRVAGIHRKTSNARRDFLHQRSAKLIAAVDLIATESLSIKNITRSAKGTLESPGRNVAQKAGLNREILATAPRAFLDMLAYKAAEAGIAFIEVPSRKVKPSQTCSDCGKQRKKALSERQHVCACGLVLTRDQNSARVNVLWALAHTGREPTGCLAQSA
jgi:putative transposase